MSVSLLVSMGGGPELLSQTHRHRHRHTDTYSGQQCNFRTAPKVQEVNQTLGYFTEVNDSNAHYS